MLKNNILGFYNAFRNDLLYEQSMSNLYDYANFMISIGQNWKKVGKQNKWASILSNYLKYRTNSAIIALLGLSLKIT